MPYRIASRFWELWTQPEVEQVWERYLITADECPRITEEILAEAQMTRGPRHVRQEYLCSFEADEAALFNPEYLERSLTLMDTETEPLWFPERNAS